MKTMLGLIYQPWQRMLRTWDHVTIYLPVVLMGALALGTYWLVRNSPVFATPEAAQASKHDVDYFMRKFTIKSFGENGQLKSEIYGVEGRHYIDTDTLEIEQPRIRNISPSGRLTTSTGKQALSNGDGSEVQLIGNALVVREAVLDADGNLLPRMAFSGDFLHAYVNEERVKSHKPVVLTRGLDQFSGDTFAYDNVSGVADLKGRVKGVLMPRMTARATLPASQPAR